MANKYGCPEAENGVFYPPLQQIVDAKPKQPGRELKRINSPVRMSERERLRVEGERYWREVKT